MAGSKKDFFTIRFYFFLAISSLLANFYCIVTETVIPASPDSNLLFPETSPIMTGAPENHNYYTAAGLRFNWATGCCSFYQITVSNSPLIVTNSIINNRNAILAIWNSQMNGDANTGYLTPNQIMAYQNDSITSTPYTFGPGSYYWSVSGFNNIGELTHSSEEKLFYVQ